MNRIDERLAPAYLALVEAVRATLAEADELVDAAIRDGETTAYCMGDSIPALRAALEHIELLMLPGADLADGL